MTSGDIVYEHDACYVGVSSTSGQDGGTPPVNILNWTSNFRASNGTTQVTMSISIDSGTSNLPGLNPFDPSKQYDIIVKEH